MSTVVTAFYDLYQNKYGRNAYYQWIKNFIPHLENNVIIFTDEKGNKVLQEICKERQTTTKIIVLPMNQFYTFKYLKHWQKDFERDHEKYYHNIALYMIWNEKSYFVKRAIEENPFNSEYFCWADIGIIRDSNNIQYIRKFPTIRSDVENDKIYLLNIIPRDISHLTPNVSEYFRFINYMGGGVIYGHKDIFLQWTKVFYETLDEFISQDLFAGKDQSIMAYVSIKFPKMVKLIKPEPSPLKDDWFYLIYYFCVD